MWKEFKAFIMRGNVIDLAVAVMIGAAFGPSSTHLSKILLCRPSVFCWAKSISPSCSSTFRGKSTITLAAAQEAGAATINYGIFINTIINFLVIAIVLFFVIKAVNATKKPATPAAPPQGLPVLRHGHPARRSAARTARRCSKTDLHYELPRGKPDSLAACLPIFWHISVIMVARQALFRLINYSQHVLGVVNALCCRAACGGSRARSGAAWIYLCRHSLRHERRGVGADDNRSSHWRSVVHRQEWRHTQQDCAESRGRPAQPGGRQPHHQSQSDHRWPAALGSCA